MLATLVIWAAVALSGAAALAYEICWSRALVVPLGNSSDAAAVVLAGFMLGIAVGARVGGGLAERVRSPLRSYALLELLLGCYAIAAPKLLGLLGGVTVGQGDVIATGLGIVTRYTGALVLIVVPGLAMGATLPLLIRALTRPGAPLGLRIGILYGANTVGAALGAFVVGFFAIATFGLWGSSALAAGASLTAAALAMIASRAMPEARQATGADADSDSEAEADTEAEAATDTEADAANGTPRRVAPKRVPTAATGRIALVATFVSGFAMLGCELLWARVLTFVFGHDTYAFASLLAFVL
ncbi:MAG: hypothetical protein JRI68_29430, partial [Deltaproteobacteria bacterium]|nr:hypothetical protein [Deltaproteobacteria bacterium]